MYICLTLPRSILDYSTLPRHALPVPPYPDMPFTTPLYPALLYFTPPHLTSSCPTLPCPSLPRPTLTRPTLPRPTLPHPILPHPTLPGPTFINLHLFQKIQVYELVMSREKEIRRVCSAFNNIITLLSKVQGDFVLVGDLMRSITLLHYKEMDHLIEEVSDSISMIVILYKKINSN